MTPLFSQDLRNLHRYQKIPLPYGLLTNSQLVRTQLSKSLWLTFISLITRKIIVNIRWQDDGLFCLSVLNKEPLAKSMNGYATQLICISLYDFNLDITHNIPKYLSLCQLLWPRHTRSFQCGWVCLWNEYVFWTARWGGSCLQCCCTLAGWRKPPFQRWTGHWPSLHLPPLEIYAGRIYSLVLAFWNLNRKQGKKNQNKDDLFHNTSLTSPTSMVKKQQGLEIERNTDTRNWWLG